MALLAAGQARRFGRTKQLLRFEGEALVTRAARAALGSPASLVVAVVGHDAPRVRTALEALPADPRLRVVVNPDYARGQGGSLRRAAEAVRDQLAAAYVAVLLADMPRVTGAHVAAVWGALVQTRRVGASRQAARAVHGPSGTPGHPVIFTPDALDALCRLPDGDDAPRTLLRTLDLLKVPCDDDGVIFDIDTPGDAGPDLMKR
ncbi:MAG TPA: nucleotidyltransferase family protein [Bacillota bacterium]